jgi:hypothetical protein
MIEDISLYAKLKRENWTKYYQWLSYYIIPIGKLSNIIAQPKCSRSIQRKAKLIA